VNPGYIPKGDFAYAPVVMKLCGIWQALATSLDDACLGGNPKASNGVAVGGRQINHPTAATSKLLDKRG
jgi:hypothetical protein